ncbi:MAG: OmpH family outer membrane protein [Leadbetterella sp.]
MKKILTLILGLAVFACSEKSTTSNSTPSKQPAGRIVYVNTDTLLNNYDYYKDVVKEFESKRFALENDLAKRSQSFQNEVALFQRRIQNGGITEAEAKATQGALQKKEQDIMILRDNAAGNLQAEQAKKTDELLNNIQTYLKKYNSGDKYDMVIGYSKGGGVLYAKEDLDITDVILKGLNEEYKSSGKKSSSADTTKKK